MDWSYVPESHRKRTQFVMKRTWISFQDGSCPRVWVELNRRQNLNWFRYRETWEPSDEFFYWSCWKSEVFLVFLILVETSLELAFIVHLADPWSKDEGWSYREDHVVEVHRALGWKSTESPYLTCQLSMFYHWQPVTGVPRTVVRVSTGAKLNDERKRQSIYTGLSPRLWLSNSLYV
jgi:hypothetical protein